MMNYILLHRISASELPSNYVAAITLGKSPTLAPPGAPLTGPALVFTTTRSRLRVEVDGLYSAENVWLALSTHLAATITDPLRFYLDFVRTPADCDKEQFAAEISRH